MSVFSSWSYTSTATFWIPDLDEYGQPVGWARRVFDCSYKSGGRQAVSSTGEEFVPTTVIYLEAPPASAPAAGWKVVVGADTATEPPPSAEVVRGVRRFDPSTFSEGYPDWEVMTS